MTHEEAVALAATKWWESKTDREIAEFQLFEERLCMPFGRFQEAMKKALGRGVWTHEFAYPELLRKELMGDRPPPSFEDILNLIPTDKRVVVVAP